LITAVSVIAAALAVAGAWQWPYTNSGQTSSIDTGGPSTQPAPGSAGSAGSPGTSGSAGSPASPEGDIRGEAAPALRRLVQRHWRKRLYEPEPEPKQEPKDPPPPLRISLVGTVLEPGRSQAIIRDSNGDTGFYRVGQQVGPDAHPATIESIGDNTIQVRRRGDVRTLKRNNAGSGS